MIDKLAKLANNLHDLGHLQAAQNIDNILTKYSGRPLPIPHDALIEFTDELVLTILSKIMSTGMKPMEFFMAALNSPENVVNSFNYDKVLLGTDVTGKEFPLVISSFITNQPGDSLASLVQVSTDSLPESAVRQLPPGHDSVKILYVKIIPETFMPRDDHEIFQLMSLDPARQITMTRNMLSHYAYSMLVHETTHAFDKVLTKDSPSFGRYERLYSDPEDKSFYYSTREELKAFLNQIVEDLIPAVFFDKEKFLASDFLTFVTTNSPDFKRIMEILKENPSDKETPSIQGTLAHRKRRARNYLLSSLYSWWELSQNKIKEDRQ